MHDIHKVRQNLATHFDPMRKQHINTVVLNTGNTLEHELKKAEIAYNLQKEGRTFICEGFLKKGARPDICVLDTSVPIAYEVMCSEKDESIQRKHKTYGDIKIITVRIQRNHE